MEATLENIYEASVWGSDTKLLSASHHCQHSKDFSFLNHELDVLVGNRCFLFMHPLFISLLSLLNQLT